MVSGPLLCRAYPLLLHHTATLICSIAPNCNFACITCASAHRRACRTNMHFSARSFALAHPFLTLPYTGSLQVPFHPLAEEAERCAPVSPRTSCRRFEGWGFSPCPFLHTNKHETHSCFAFFSRSFLLRVRVWEYR